MRAVALFLCFGFAAVGASAQTPASTEGSPVQIVKYSWSKDRIDWENDPFSAADDFKDIPLRRSRERRRSGSVLQQRDEKIEEREKERPPAPPRYSFNYKLSVHNTGPKAIKELDWDYVFTDTATGEELGRREFTSTEKIGPNKRKDLSILVSSPPTKRVSAYTLGKRERDGLVEQVIVVRILYDDGTTWQAR